MATTTPNRSPIAAQVAALRRVPERALGVLRDLQGTVAELSTTPRVAPDAPPAEFNRAQEQMRQEVAAAREQAVGALRELREASEVQRSSASAVIRGIVDGPAPTDPTEVLAREVALSGAWDRSRRVFDGLHPAKAVDRAIELVSDAIRTGDPFMPAALRRELPLYLEARGEPELWGRALGRINDAEAAHRPEIAAALADMADLDRGWARIDLALSEAAVIAGGGNPTYRMLPGWAADGSEDLLVNYPPNAIPNGFAGTQVTLDRGA